MKQKMKIAAIIPARFQSTRFEGKPLVDICGMTMIERVYRQVEKCGKFLPGHIIVATDDQRIADEVERFGGYVQMTASSHTSGSERLWEVMDTRGKQGEMFDAAINIQGDEPIISPHLIASLYDVLSTGNDPVVTPAYYNRSYKDFVSRHVTKVVLDNQNRALYFSRSPIPFTPQEEFKGFFHHLGMYGYLRNTLEQFVAAPRAKLEAMEKLEQLRFLENRVPVKVISSSVKSVGVDVPEDLEEVVEFIRNEENSIKS